MQHNHYAACNFILNGDTTHYFFDWWSYFEKQAKQNENAKNKSKKSRISTIIYITVYKCNYIQ